MQNIEYSDSSTTKGSRKGKGFINTCAGAFKPRTNPITRTINGVIDDIKKRIEKHYEIPPTKNGRIIPFCPHETDTLVDERTGLPYINNTVRSSRYTAWNFLPKQLAFQFSKLANFFFLCISILQMIPTLSTTGSYTTIVPLLFFITLSISREGYDDFRRYQGDKLENKRVTTVFRPDKKTLESTTDTDMLEDSWVDCQWQDVRVGDVVRIERDEQIPADLVILHSDGLGGNAYIETMALDGETNLKTKQALPSVSKPCGHVESLATLEAEFVVEDPNLDLYNFEGKVTIGGETVPLSNGQIVYRGSILRNTPNMIGLVIFTGEETKIRMNSNKNPRTKAPTMQTLVNKIVVFTVFLVLFLSAFMTVAYQIWQRNVEKGSWYLADGGVGDFQVFASFIIMFNTLIPLSLYISLEIVKVGQIVFMNDIDMYHEESDTPFEARTSTINEECGQVSYLFSDKTGTLTDNTMEFRKLSIAGVAWLHDLDIKRAGMNGDRPLIKHKRRKKKGHSYKPRESHGDAASAQKSKNKQFLEHRLSMHLGYSDPHNKGNVQSSIPQPELSTVDLIQYLKDHPHTFFSRKARFMLLSLALCNTCLPEEKNGDITYQAASPDELALVTAAKDLGYMVVDRQIDTITVKTFPNGDDGEPLYEEYKVLDVIEFTSARKRMSIIIRLPNGKICIFSKGADSTMTELLKLKDLAQQKALEVEKRVNIRKSMEVQEVIRRNSMQRQSMSRTPRGSLQISRVLPAKDELDMWLRDKDREGDNSSLDSDSIYSRPSMSYAAARHSLAFGEPKLPLERDKTDQFVDEAVAMDDGTILEKCFTHINEFATEGLRTLMYGYRMLEEEEYQTWKKIYSEATTSLVNRKEKSERAADLIERNFELAGATAIEDKLQKGVPDAIDKLLRAGIKMWMLTGDKRETAINIGHSCHLIRDYSTLTILDKDGVEPLKTVMENGLREIEGGNVAHSVVVVDGGTLTTIDADEELKAVFFSLVVTTDCVVCCRASPSQKASLVKKVRTKVPGSVTLAIGDGANDCAMIQEAHIGVGITGKEGLQAARVSDYSFAQFRFLTKFLLVHGHWNYVRTAKYTVGTFWKELLFYTTAALYQRYNGYTGTSFFESWSLSMFNTLFTSLPVIVLGTFEKDLAASTLLAVPELYIQGPQNRRFNFRIYVGWMVLAAIQAVCNYYIIHTIYTRNDFIDNGVFAQGVLVYTTTVVLVSAKLQMIEMHNKSVIAFASVFLSIGGWFAWNLIFAGVYADNTVYNVKGGLTTRFGRDLSWWTALLLSITVCLLIDIAFISLRTAFFPTDIDTFQEIEQSTEFKQRLEEAAANELQQGWQRRKKSEDIRREEGEVQELLDRRMEQENFSNMEQGRASAAGGPSVPPPRPSMAGRSGSYNPGRPSVQAARKSAVIGETLEEEEDIEEIVAKRFGQIRR
ncbi:P-type ATPase [Ascobolus immersus RN42]|uniref:Phospholipid-transporting ATPase n=1 Tax=Ascobolus immersus RN42 TaxID=1160509 RepID=A0A3N4H9H1_ASCIM|nr:P-type ATPase [Ascobolus immersus RN42]